MSTAAARMRHGRARPRHGGSADEARRSTAMSMAMRRSTEEHGDKHGGADEHGRDEHIGADEHADGADLHAAIRVGQRGRLMWSSRSPVARSSGELRGMPILIFFIGLTSWAHSPRHPSIFFSDFFI